MSPPPRQAIGAVIRRQREINALSIRQFAAMAGISNPYLSQIERGLREPSQRVLEALASSLGRPASELFEEAGIPADAAEDTRTGARDALEGDPNLTPRQRRALLDVYDSFAENNRRRGRQSQL
jgi:transcriptional regulator with XRE-family HTH domain